MQHQARPLTFGKGAQGNQDVVDFLVAYLRSSGSIGGVGGSALAR